MLTATEAQSPSRARQGRGKRRAAAVAVLFVLLFGLLYMGRWRTVETYDSGEYTAATEQGTESAGGQGPFRSTGRAMRLNWRLSDGVESIRLVVARAGDVASLENWPETPSPNPKLELRVTRGLSKRSGTWQMPELEPGEYWIRYEWSTRGRRPASWRYNIERRDPWWSLPRKNS